MNHRRGVLIDAWERLRHVYAYLPMRLLVGWLAIRLIPLCADNGAVKLLLKYHLFWTVLIGLIAFQKNPRGLERRK